MLYTKLIRSLRVLITVSLLLGLLVACGGEEEYEEYEEPTESIEVEEEEATEEPAEEADSTPLYVHPSGAFGMIYPFGTEPDAENESAVFFSDANSMIFAVYNEAADAELDENTLGDIAVALTDAFLVEGGIVESYDMYTDDAESVGEGYEVAFDYASSEYGDGTGKAYFTKSGEALYIVYLLAQDYEAAAETWAATVSSFTTEPEAQAGNEEPAESSEEQPAESSSAQPSGEADSGFRPETDGFSFENYGGGGETNLTPTEMQRMFGDQVCANTSGGTCTLTPPARQWMEQINGYMDGGHCEGMAVLSSLMYYGQVDPTNFGGESTHDLSIADEALQREIAYWWTTQSTYPGASIKVNESPTEVINTLTESFAQGKDASEWWAMGIYKSDFTGGHAITPIGVEDKGDGLYDILVYDNNWPNETRVVEVDTNENTWKYHAATNPNEPSELYDGNAELQNLEVVAISPRLDTQQCQFCASGAESRAGGLAAPAQEFYEIWLEGKADLLIEDEQGRRIGFVDGKFVSEIPGASGDNMKLFGTDVWDTENEPVYRVPVGVSFQISVDGTSLEEAESSQVTLIGPGYVLYVEDIWLEPGEVDSINVYTDESRHQLTYITDYSESPVMVIGIETDEADYEFLVQATEMIGAADTFDIAVDLAENDFIINTSYNEEPVTFDMWMLRIDDEGESIFGYEDLVMEPENTAYLNYLTWEGEGSVMYLDMDYENDGEIDESIELEDTADEYFYDYSGEDSEE